MSLNHFENLHNQICYGNIFQVILDIFLNHLENLHNQIYSGNILSHFGYISYSNTLEYIFYLLEIYISKYLDIKLRSHVDNF